MCKKILWLLICFIVSTLYLYAEEPVKLDFKQFFKTKTWPIVSKGFADNSVSLEQDIFVKTPPSFRIDCSRTQEKIVSITFYLVKENFEMFRGKTVYFKAKIKRLSGAEKPYIQVRFHNFDGTKFKYLFGTSQPFDISTSDEWTEVSLKCDIPSQENVNAADFQIYVRNSSTPTVFIVDECSIVEIPAEPQTDKQEKTSALFFCPVLAGIQRHLRL